MISRLESNRFPKITASERAGQSVTGAAPTVLVVEDDAAMRQMCLDLLERQGYAVEGAGSFDEAIARIKAGMSGNEADQSNTPKIQLVLSDIRLGPRTRHRIVTWQLLPARKTEVGRRAEQI